MGKHQLFLSLGGNLGNKREIFSETLRLIESGMGKILKMSSSYESVAWGFRSRRLFRNQVILVDTLLTPEEVLTTVREIEKHFGRHRKPGKYLSRKMDIDILFYDDLIVQTEELTIPHPLLAARKFVLIPFLEVDPEFYHPVLKKKIGEICLKCRDHSQIRKIDENK